MCLVKWEKLLTWKNVNRTTVYWLFHSTDRNQLKKCRNSYEPGITERKGASTNHSNTNYYQMY
jgi:hypothetical protein